MTYGMIKDLSFYQVKSILFIVYLYRNADIFRIFKMFYLLEMNSKLHVFKVFNCHLVILFPLICGFWNFSKH